MDLIMSDHSMPDVETRPSDDKILGLYVWAGKGTQRSNDEAAVDEEIE